MSSTTELKKWEPLQGHVGRSTEAVAPKLPSCPQQINLTNFLLTSFAITVPQNVTSGGIQTPSVRSPLSIVCTQSLFLTIFNYSPKIFAAPNLCCLATCLIGTPLQCDL